MRLTTRKIINRGPKTINELPISISGFSKAVKANITRVNAIKKYAM